MIRIGEIISADVRCSNHVLLSFGVCVNEPLMRRDDTIQELTNTFGRDNVRAWFTLNTEIVDSPENRQTVKEFRRANMEGHFALFIQGHALALHNGVLVDTAGKGISRQRVDEAYKILNHDQQIEEAFEDYRRNYPQNIFTKPKKRKPKYRFTVSSILLGVEKKINAKLRSSERSFLRREVVKRAEEQDMGIRDSEDGTLLFSNREGSTLMGMALDMLEDYENVEERYVGGEKTLVGDYSEIFANPNRKELRDAMEDGMIRFIADARTETVYVFSVNLLHMDAAKKIDRMLYEYTRNGGSRQVLLGTGTVEGSLIDVMELTGIESVFGEGDTEILPEYGIFEDWTWAEEYIDEVDATLDQYREAYQEEAEYGLV